MKRKISGLSSGAKQGLFALSLAVIFNTAHAQTTYTFLYTGGVQTLAVQPGNYEITCWGANGGDGGGTSANAGSGGKGGYSKGNYAVTSATTLYIYVGGKGISNNTTVSASVTAPGGWNGGGGGFSGGTTQSLYKGGGGGGSDVRTTQNATYANRIIVAGGGGGAGGAGSSGYLGLGGNGGGSSGQDGILGSSQSNHNGKGGSQTAGGAGGVYSSAGGQAGSLGIGGDGGSGSTNYFPAGGGGGGYYGGGGGAIQGGGGGGGSSYIGGVTSATTIMSGQSGFVTNPDVTGNGRVLIRELCSITLSVTGVNANGAICSGSSVSLTTDAVSNYSWSTGASTSSIIVTPTVTTGYTLTATSPSSCTASAVVTIQVNSGSPTLTIANTATNSSGVCPGKTVALTASGATTYTWTGGVVNGATFVPTSTQTYVVTGENACGTSTAATSVSIHPLPNIVLTASQPTVCTTQSISLCPSGGVSYTMSPYTPTCSPYYPFTNQTYTVRGTSALGCTNSAMATVNVTVTPVIPPVVSPTLICIGNSATLSATGASNYSWTSTGLSGVVTTSSLVVNPTGSTTYSLTKWNGNCVNSDSVRLIVNPLPTVFAVANPATVCASTPATLQAGGGTSYQWAPGNLPSGPGAASIVVYPAQTTIYTVTATDGTCSGVGTVSVATNPNPIITILTSTNSMCVGQSMSYTVMGADTYTYSNNPSTSPPFSGTTGVVSPTLPTSYQVVGMNQFNCTSSASSLLFVHGLPPITITRTPTLVCVGFPSTLTATGSVISNTVHLYSWMHGGNTNKSVVNPLVTSIYTVSGTNTVTSCQNTQTVMVAVFQPSWTTTPDTAICKGGNITLTASGANSYSWTGGPNPANNVAFYNVSPTVLTVYSVTARSTTLTLSCYSAKTISVGIYLQPTVTASPSRTQAVCRNESVYLRGHGADTYYWPSINQTGDSVQVFPIQQTTYRVIGTDIYACKDTFDLLVKFSNCPGFDELNKNQLEVSVFPNPNNGVFTVKAPFDIRLTLINELGQVVRELSLTKAGNWSADVRDLPPGAYFLTGRHEDNYISEKIMISR